MTQTPTLQQKLKLLFIVGPTASGKTEFALKAAKDIEQKTNQTVEIINSDSVQVYQGVEIGTAKPTPEQLAQRKHHLIGTVRKGEAYTAGRYRDDATKIIEDAAQRNVGWLLIVGGSGFYVQALEKGMFDVPSLDAKIREHLEQELKATGIEKLYQELKEKDPAYAEKVKPQDTYRTLRALELMRALKKTMTEIQVDFDAQKNGLAQSYEIHKIGLKPDREELRKRVVKRTHQMLEQGLIEEVRQLRDEGLTTWAPLQSVGYKEAQLFLDGELEKSKLAELIAISTMQLAKRQMTWFKRDQGIKWAVSESGFEQATALLHTMLT